jgi:nicotinamide-nucleotide adenylyltransferase
MRDSKMKIGVYCGRFNPPHKGHLALIKRLKGKVGRLVIVIGCSELRNQKRNPFSGSERKRMLEAYLKELGIRGVQVVNLSNRGPYSHAIKNLLGKYGGFDVLFNDNKTVARLIGKRAKVVSFKRIGTVSSTMIRDRIAHGGEWESLTGKSVARLIRRFDGVRRIRNAYKTRWNGRISC